MALSQQKDIQHGWGYVNKTIRIIRLRKLKVLIGKNTRQ
jgi:hypothetical protein